MGMSSLLPQPGFREEDCFFIEFKKRKDGFDENAGVCLGPEDSDVFDFMFFVMFGGERLW
ncbi:hypothetical protein BU251_07645 [Candidatus Velamenicoccus archaeovorus]|uniref:Uncharacterized protein n=1 Tax=Velamenicoccus archaeovorus TaxID=1930593 RepID=A0A410P5Y0_VELA1|nr:hypothetical protein BU251_07645 [Candidatus Velamenicoccus archaeovorus]